MPDVIAKMEERVRARGNQIINKSGRDDSSMKNYAWQFEATVVERKGAKP